MDLAPEGTVIARGSCVALITAATDSNDGHVDLGLAEARTFGEVDRAGLNLTELPCDEAAGMIFVILTPGCRSTRWRGWTGCMRILPR